MSAMQNEYEQSEKDAMAGDQWDETIKVSVAQN